MSEVRKLDVAAAATLRHPDELIARGLAATQDRVVLEDVAARYAIALTPAVVALIDPTDPHDPIARQYVPRAEELDALPIERADPIGDAAHSPVEGIVHRHRDRVLFKPVHVCAVYCRFCFRRESVGPGKDNALSTEATTKALDYIRTHPEIWEVIFTGGDPLMLSPRRLADIMAALGSIDHVKIIRFHTRLPVADPERITPALVRALTVPRKTVWMALHANHPRELSEAARAACARIIDAGIPMVSQSVLLSGVNDDVDTLEALMRGFVECRIKPYYLHHGDLAPGTAHLRTTLEAGQALLRELRGRVSGLCQPHYVLDIPGGYGKAPVGPNYLFTGDGSDSKSRYRVADYCGDLHAYPPPGA
ncbi:lysine-2,3-aminomutase-like protein [Rhodopseudomonas sp. B29]|uniref:lysine-2,3-aminomutase-like protein n=1 Tax=Rhodopseudomonas sp. B29 TaxID=95607 RepID=UPI0003B63A77|nr:lysine-2,3-aminomutase-like protein [Rhodopseudomonas sp. B29]